MLCWDRQGTGMAMGLLIRRYCLEAIRRWIGGWRDWGRWRWKRMGCLISESRVGKGNVFIVGLFRKHGRMVVLLKRLFLFLPSVICRVFWLCRFYITWVHGFSNTPWLADPTLANALHHWVNSFSVMHEQWRYGRR